MTFIASVVAKDGVAVIADSLVTSSTMLLPLNIWRKFLQGKKGGVKAGEDYKITEEEVTDLFIRKRSHTKDYQNKLFEFDDHTLITTAGLAALNKKEIGSIVEEIRAKMTQPTAVKAETLDDKIKNFCDLFKEYVDDEFAQNAYVDDLTLIYTNYDTSLHVTHIYRITAGVEANEDQTELVTKVQFQKVSDPVVCDGQSTSAYNILSGGAIQGLQWFSHTVDLMKEEYNVPLI